MRTMRGSAWRRPIQLAGKRVRLRSARTGDQAALERLRADPEIDYFMGVEPSSAGVLWRQIFLGDQSGAMVDLVITDEHDRPLGLLSLWDRTIPHQAAELSIWMGSSYRSGGLGTEAVQLALHYCFIDLRLHKVYLRVLDYNARAIRAYEKCGFRAEGVLREEMLVGGGWHALVYMGILAHEFAAAASHEAGEQPAAAVATALMRPA